MLESLLCFKEKTYDIATAIPGSCHASHIAVSCTLKKDNRDIYIFITIKSVNILRIRGFAGLILRDKITAAGKTVKDSTAQNKRADTVGIAR